MSLRLNSDSRHKSKYRPIKDKGFEKVKNEHNDMIKLKNRKNIKEYESYPELSSTENLHINAKLASQAAMAVLSAKSIESSFSNNSKQKFNTRKHSRIADIKPININNGARSKVEEIYKKQILPPDIIYRQQIKQGSPINQNQPPRLQDLAAKVTLYEDNNKYMPTLPNNDFVYRKSSKPMSQKQVTETPHFHDVHQRKLYNEEIIFNDDHRKKTISPVMSALAANKALVEFNSYEKQQDLIKKDLLRKIKEQKEELNPNSHSDIEDNYGLFEGNTETSGTILPPELKKAALINKSTNDFVNKIIASHKFGAQQQKDDNLSTSDHINSENDGDYMERLSDLDEPSSVKQIEDDNTSVEFKTPQKARIPPPAVSPSLITQQTQSSVSELINMNSKNSSDFVTNDNSEKVKFNDEHSDNKLNKEKRSLSLAENSGDHNSMTKTRSHRSNTISTLFHNMITSSNNSSPSTHISNDKSTAKRVVSFSSNDKKEGTLPMDSNSINAGSKNIFKRTMRSLSLSKKSSEPSIDAGNNEITEKDESKTNDKLRHSPKIEYSVLHNNLLPSYYKNEEGTINNSSDGKGKVQFRTTLRDNFSSNIDNKNSNSKHKRLLGKLHLVHMNEKNSDTSNSSKTPISLAGSNLNSKKKAYIDKKRGDKPSSRFSDSEYSDSDSDYDSDVEINNFGSSHHNILNSDTRDFGNDPMNDYSEVHDYDEDLQKYHKAKKHDNKVKHNISGGGKKSDIFIKIPAKLAYNTVKKRTENWEIRKNHTLKNVLKNDENIPSAKALKTNDPEPENAQVDAADSIISDTLNPSSTMILTDSKAMDDVSTIKHNEAIPPKNALNESSYIIGVHTKSNNKKKFDENKPWKSHVDVGYITSEEKKRYEAIWVSNKNRYLEMLPWYQSKQEKNDLESDNNCMSVESSGFNMDKEIDDSIHLNKEDYEEDLMVNFVAYEIFNRSNLPPKVLKKIYDLIDMRHDGALNKQSFIVGMWLIDQCLYGKKLPDSVPDLVWTSVDKMVIGVDISHKSLLRNKKKIARQEIKDLKKHEKVVKEYNKKEQQNPKQAN